MIQALAKLKNIFCNCHEGSTASCGYWENGLHCTEICCGCQGITCLNKAPVELQEIAEILEWRLQNYSPTNKV